MTERNQKRKYDKPDQVQPLVYVLFLRSFVNELSNDLDFILFSRFKALRIVSNNFAVPLEFNLLLNVMDTSLDDIVICWS